MFRKNGGSGLDWRFCGRGPSESIAEDVDGSSIGRQIESAVIESYVPGVTLRNEGQGAHAGSCWTAPRTSRYSNVSKLTPGPPGIPLEMVLEGERV